jgi:hypothetical protein
LRLACNQSRKISETFLSHGSGIADIVVDQSIIRSAGGALCLDGDDSGRADPAVVPGMADMISTC